MFVRNPLALGAAFLLVAVRGFADGPVVPADFTVSEFARAPLVQNVVSFSFDEQGRLFVAETERLFHGAEDNRVRPWLNEDLAAGVVADRVDMIRRWADQFGGMYYFTNHEDRVRMVTDTNGDGRADTAVNFADNFRAPEDGVGAGILAHNGTVWYACVPNLWRLADHTGDGRADVRQPLFTGFGVRFSEMGHDLHGLAWGPDDRVYFTVGDRGFHVTNREGRVLHGGGEGAVFRCEPDGSNLEVFYHNLRNPMELAFDDEGNLFTDDNNADHGDRARVTWIMEGGDSGWNMSFQSLDGRNVLGPFMQEDLWRTNFPGQAAYITPPIAYLASGPSGIAHDPGGFLPGEDRGGFLLCDFTGGAASASIWSFHIEPSGAAFRITGAKKFITQTLPTDVDFGYDGCIYFSDWISGWEPNGKGIIWRAMPTNEAMRAQGAESAAIFREGFGGRSSDQLAAWLAHPDYRVRQRSHIELARRGETVRLDEIATHGTKDVARRHAIWALGIIARKNWRVLENSPGWLADPNPDIRAQACRVIGDANARAFAPQLVARLADENAHVRALAAIAIGKLHTHGAETSVVQMLEQNADRDPWLRYAGIIALAGSDTADQLRQFATHTNASVRIAAVVALRRQCDEGVADFLGDTNDLVVLEAARAVHDLPTVSAMPKLAAMIDKYDGVSPPLLRRIISANFQLGDADRVAKVAALLERDLSTELQGEVTDALRHWPWPQSRDRVTGEFREQPARGATAGNLTNAVWQAVEKMCASKRGAAHVAALALSKDYRMALPRDFYLAVFHDANADENSRAESFAALVMHDNDPDVAALSPFTLAHEGLADRHSAVRIEARRQIARLDPSGSVAELADAVEHGGRAEAQDAIGLLAQMQNQPAAVAHMARWVAALTADTLRTDVALEILQCAPTMKSEPLKRAFAAHMSGLATNTLAARYAACRNGGEPQKGRFLFDSDRCLCTKCHKVGGVGGSDAGPDLGGVASRRNREELLLALIDPNAQIAEGFSAPSPMPPMGLSLPLRDVRDLVAYLSTLVQDTGPGAGGAK